MGAQLQTLQHWQITADCAAAAVCLDSRRLPCLPPSSSTCKLTVYCQHTVGTLRIRSSSTHTVHHASETRSSLPTWKPACLSDTGAHAKHTFCLGWSFSMHLHQSASYKLSELRTGTAAAAAASVARVASVTRGRLFRANWRLIVSVLTCLTWSACHALRCTRWQDCEPLRWSPHQASHGLRSLPPYHLVRCAVCLAVGATGS
jgi:hypothetical protein